MKTYYKFRLVATVLWSGKIKRKRFQKLQDYSFTEYLPASWLCTIATSADEAQKRLTEWVEKYVAEQAERFQINGNRLSLTYRDTNGNICSSPDFYELNTPVVTCKEIDKPLIDYSKTTMKRAIEDLTMVQFKEMFESIPLDKI